MDPKFFYLHTSRWRRSSRGLLLGRAAHDRARHSKKSGRGAPRYIPAILLAKRALAEHLYGQHLGNELLVVALHTIVEAARRADGEFVVVDAIDDTAAAFYRHHDFEPLPANPLQVHPQALHDRQSHRQALAVNERVRSWKS